MALPDRDHLKGFILRFLQQENRGDEVSVANPFQEDFILLFGLLQRVRHLARCHLALSKDGYGSVGRVLVRAALEHSVTAQWAFFTEGGVQRLKVAIGQDQRDLAIAIEAKDQDYLRRLEAAIPAGKGMPKWTDIVRDCDDSTRFVAQSYKVLSQAAHVTHSATVDAISMGESGELSLVLRPEDELEHQVLYALAGCCMLSAWLFAVLGDDQEEQRRLISVSSSLFLPWTIAHNLPAARRRVFVDGMSPIGGWFPGQ